MATLMNAKEHVRTATDALIAVGRLRWAESRNEEVRSAMWSSAPSEGSRSAKSAGSVLRLHRAGDPLA